MANAEVRFTMRMNKKLYEQLKECAASNHRSIAKELEHITDAALNGVCSREPITDEFYSPEETEELFRRFISFLRNQDSRQNSK